MSLPYRRCVRCSQPLLSSSTKVPGIQRLWQTLVGSRLFSSAASTETSVDSSLAALRSNWPSSASSSSRSVVPRSSTSSTSSTSSSSHLSAERRAVSLAQREAEAERRRAVGGRSVKQPTERVSATANRPSVLPSPSTVHSSLTSSSSIARPQPSAVHSPTLHPLTGLGSAVNNEVMSAEEEAEQLALIDELTDYIGAYRHPASASASDRGVEDGAMAGSMDSAMSVLHENEYFMARPRTTAAYNKLIQQYAAAGAVQHGLAILHSMNRRGVTPDSGTYTAMVRVCGALQTTASADEKEQSLRRAFSLLVELKEVGLSPTLSFFNALIDTCTRLSSASRALSVVSLMAEHGVSADVVTYTSLLSLYRDPAVSVEQLKQLWFDLRNSGQPPDTSAYNTAIRAVAQHGEAEYALMLFNDMQQDGVRADTYTYNALMYACARRPDFYMQAIDLFQQALAQRHTLDKLSYSILLYAAARNRDVGNAIKVFEQMEKAGVVRDTAAYNTVMHCIANSQQQQQVKLSGSVLDMTQKDRMVMAERLLVQMEANSVPIDDRTVLAALRVWTEAVRLRTAESKRLELISRYVKLDSEQQRVQGRGEFDVRLWEAMLRMYGRARRTKEAMAVLQRLEADGLLAALNSKLLHRLLHVCAQQADEASGVWLLAAMGRVNVQPSSEHVRLFDSEQYRQWLQRQHKDKKQGAIPAISESARQQLRDRAWYGSKALKRPSTSRPSDSSTQKWMPSTAERKAREKAETRRRKTDKRLVWESR